MSDAPIKTLYLKGTLTEGIKIKLYPLVNSNKEDGIFVFLK